LPFNGSEKVAAGKLMGEVAGALVGDVARKMAGEVPRMTVDMVALATS
jgi:hypothetical protein